MSLSARSRKDRVPTQTKKQSRKGHEKWVGLSMTSEGQRFAWPRKKEDSPANSLRKEKGGEE